MNDIIQKITAWIKANKLLAVAIGGAALLMFFPKIMRFGRNTYRRRRRIIPRAVGMRRRKVYTKGGRAKRPWQIKGSLAARRHMAQIRRMK